MRLERGSLSDEGVRRVIAQRFVPVRVTACDTPRLQAEFEVDPAGDLLVVSPSRVVLRRFDASASPSEVLAGLTAILNRGWPKGGQHEPRVPVLIARMSHADGPGEAAQRDLARVLADAPHIDWSGIKAGDARVVRLLLAWWEIFRDALVWRPEVGRYEYLQTAVLDRTQCPRGVPAPVR